MLAAIAVAVLVMVGMVVAWRTPTGLRVGGVLFSCLVGATALGGGLVRLGLSMRADEKEPVFFPAPLNSVLGALGMLLVTAGPVIAGALLTVAYREAQHGRAVLAMLYVTGLWYVVHWAPWVIHWAFA